MIFPKIRELRENKEISQENVSCILGIKQQTYSLFENGDKIIPLKHLNTLCNYYGVSMDYMVGLSSIRNYEIINKELDKKIMGERLRMFRENNNIKQEQLSKLLNTSHSTISAYENGKTMILTAFAYEISRYYKISMDYLCGRIEKNKKLV